MKYIRKIVYPLTIIIVLIIVISYIVIKKNLEDNSDVTILEDNLFINETLDEKEEEKIINVDIKGAVKKPGVYKVNDSLVINDQTCPIMIQRLNNIFQRNPLISMEI